MRRVLFIATVLALCCVAGASPTVRNIRRSTAALSDKQVAASRGPTVDMAAQASTATYYSVCLSDSAPSPTVSPLPSPLPQPVLDKDTNSQFLRVVKGRNTQCVAWGFHNDDIETIGWSTQHTQLNCPHRVCFSDSLRIADLCDFFVLSFV